MEIHKTTIGRDIEVVWSAAILFFLIPSVSFPEKRSSEKKEQPPNPSLPDDLLLSCFARISTLYYPSLSLVSKSFRSLLISPELYKVRSLSDQTDNCLYVCIQFSSGQGPSWYTLCRKPDQTLTKSLSSYVLAKVPIPNSPRASFKGLVSVGHNIYNINSGPVSILDCRSHTWSEAPSLRVELPSVSATVIDRKIYVAGRSRDSENSLQVFDTQTRTWDPVAIRLRDGFHKKTTSVDGYLHVVAKQEVVAYDHKKGRWGLGRSRMDCYMDLSAYCEIDKVLYSASRGVFRWFDTKWGRWRKLKGLAGLPEITCEARVRLADYGGKMAVLWHQHLSFYNRFSPKKMIWCAEISLERRNNGCEIWGKVEWFDHVLTLPPGCHVVKVLGVTVWGMNIRARVFFWCLYAFNYDHCTCCWLFKTITLIGMVQIPSSLVWTKLSTLKIASVFFPQWSINTWIIYC